MKIMLINPDSGMNEEDLKKRCNILSEYCGEDVELHMECITESNYCLDSMFEAVMISPEIVKRAIQAEKDGYDAIVLYCFSDPALEACQEVLTIPVVGAGMAACHVASFISRQSGLLLSEEKRIPEKMTYCQQKDFMPRTITAIDAVDLEGINVWDSRDKVIIKMQQASRKMMEKYGVQAIIIGCLSYLGIARDLSQKIGIPVIDAAIAGVSMAECLVRQKLSISKKSFPKPY